MQWTTKLQAVQLREEYRRQVLMRALQAWEEESKRRLQRRMQQRQVVVEYVRVLNDVASLEAGSHVVACFCSWKLHRKKLQEQEPSLSSPPPMASSQRLASRSLQVD